ncbi:MAG TPA: D-arabinono-1,4-lactone oxidase [Solirubrobacteraceae bacterium]|nr:D-arabinono-1,4-lactone oxidase [Solirubrobacteraceae bacterium]
MGPTWRNHSRDQQCRPRAIAHPQSTDDLVQLVRDAERSGSTVRAVGAGHAWSDVALTDGTLVETDRLTGPLELDDGTLRPGALEGPPLVRVRAGTRIRQLNALLESRGLALRNMGGYDGQAIAGVVSTSTHGSGIRFGPFPDVVRSLDLVVARGVLVRVEPEHGITDPTRFTGTLIQDDDVFASVVCGMGCIGIIDSLVLEVRSKFWLRERRVVRTWDEVRGDLEGGVLDRHDHYEVFLNPYAREDGHHDVLVTTRDEVAEPGAGSPGEGERHPLIEIQSSIPLVWVALRLAARWVPRLVRTQFGRTLRRMEDENYTQVSYRVFNIGAANHLPALSMEIGVPVEGDNHLRAVECLFEVADECARERRLFHTSPISLRFVAPSRAYASMMYGTPTMMIELILISGTKGGRSLLAEHERRLAEFGARPHWGQYNTLGPQSGLATLYPRWDTWLEVRERFNETGVFNSEFTDRVGISAAVDFPGSRLSSR